MLRWPLSCRLGRSRRDCKIVPSTRYEQRRFLPESYAVAGGDYVIVLPLPDQWRKCGHVELRLVRQ